jgi:hypothetical protein
MEDDKVTFASFPPSTTCTLSMILANLALIAGFVLMIVAANKLPP